MINRKDSLCYIDFLRGKYNSNDIEYIKILINKMTINEKSKLIRDIFDDLWMDLWNLKKLTKELVEKNDYKEGKKYELLKNGFYHNKKLFKLEEIINSSETNYQECEWEFQKVEEINTKKIKIVL